MSEGSEATTRKQLWNIANTLRGKMNADEFRDCIPDFIFYKYLSEKLHLKANELLKQDNLDYEDIEEDTEQGKQILTAIEKETLNSSGYFLKLSELFHPGIEQ